MKKLLVQHLLSSILVIILYTIFAIAFVPNSMAIFLIPAVIVFLYINSYILYFQIHKINFYKKFITECMENNIDYGNIHIKRISENVLQYTPFNDEYRYLFKISNSNLIFLDRR